MFTVGRFATISGVSAKKLRHYHQIGLFRPAWVDPATRYRYYLAAQIPELRRIMALAALGIPLRTIVRLVDGGASLEEELSRRRDDMMRQRRDLDRRLAALDIRIGRSGDDVVVRNRPPGRWASLRAQLPPESDLGPLFVAAEEHVRMHIARAALPPVAVSHGSAGAGYEAEVLIPITRHIPETEQIRVRRTPPAKVASRLHSGDYPSLHGAARGLAAWAEATGYRVAGPPWIVYLRYSAEPELALPDGFLASRSADFLSEVQVPVEADIGPRKGLE